MWVKLSGKAWGTAHQDHQPSPALMRLEMAGFSLRTGLRTGAVKHGVELRCSGAEVQAMSERLSDEFE